MFRLAPEQYQNYLRSKDSFILSELTSLSQTLVNMLNREEDDILYEAPIVNLEVVGYETYQLYGLMWRFKYLSTLISELNWREGGCKDNNKDIPWENLMGLHDYIDSLWDKRRQEWIGIKGSDKKKQIELAESQFIQFLKNLLVADLQELTQRLDRVLMKEHCRFLNSPTTNLFFSLRRPESLVYGSRTAEVLEDNRVPEWYETSPFAQSCFFPDESGQAIVVFKREAAKAVLGLPSIRAFTEPRADLDCLRCMLDVMKNLKKLDSKWQQGKEAILMACQSLGEYSHWLSDSFKNNLNSLAVQFPFKALRETRNAVKLAVSHQHRFLRLCATLQPSAANDLLYEKILGELLSLESLLNQMIVGITPYLSDNYRVSASSNWMVANPAMLQAFPIQVANLDAQGQEIFTLFDSLSMGITGELKDKAQNARIFLEHILCNNVPFIEIKNERDQVVTRVNSVISEMCGFQFSIGDNAHKGQAQQNRKKILRLIGRKVLEVPEIPLVCTVPGPPKEQLENLYDMLNSSPPGPRLSERDYVESYLNLILDSIKTMTTIVVDLRRSGRSLDQIRQLLDEDPNVNYSVRFYVTVIGQSIRSLEKCDLFVANAGEDLLAEFYSFRWVRNNEMHNMNQPIGESLLRWYNRRVNQVSSRHTASEISAYVVYLERILKQIKQNMDDRRQANKEPYLIACVQNDLSVALSKSGITYFMNVPDDLWLYRDQMRMIWKFLLPLKTPNLNVVLFAQERTALNPSQAPGLYLYKHQELPERRTTTNRTIILKPAQRPEHEWTCLVIYGQNNYYDFTIEEPELEVVLDAPLASFRQVEGKIVLPYPLQSRLRSVLLEKEHLRAPVSYLQSQGLQNSAWVTLHDLYLNQENLNQAANNAKLTIRGIDDGPMSDEWDAPLKISVASTELFSTVEVQEERLANFRRAASRLLGSNVVVDEDPQFQPRYDLQVVVNSYFLFKSMQYCRPTLQQLKAFVLSNVIDINFYVEGYTILHALKRNYERTDQNYLEIAAYLIDELGADPSLLDKHDDTVLHEAAREGDTEYCRFLLSCEMVNPNQLNGRGRKPVEIAAEYQQLTTVELLFPHTTMTPKQGLMMAIDLHSMPMAQEALRVDPTVVNGEDSFGNIPIIKAAESGCLAMVKLLIDAGANSQELSEGDTLLHVHCRSNNPNPSLVQYLVRDCDVLVDTQNSQNSTALHLASACHYLDLVRALLRLTADSTLVNDRGETALHKVAQCIAMDDNALAIAQLLVEAGTPLRQQDKFAGTILHLAALEDHKGLARMVLTKDPSLLDIQSQGNFCQGELPVEVARFKGHVAFAAILTQHRHHVLQQYKFQQNSWTAVGGVLSFGATMLFSRGSDSMGARLGLSSAIGILGGIAARKGYQYLRAVPVIENNKDETKNKKIP